MDIGTPTSPATLKTYYETGDVPTQSEFEELIDSNYNKFDGLGIKGVVSTAETIEIPSERELVSIHIWATANRTIKVGDSTGSGEYFDGDIVANVPLSLNIGIFAINPKTIHITANGATNVKFYIR